jgi:general secretion pathway protein M
VTQNHVSHAQRFGALALFVLVPIVLLLLAAVNAAEFVETRSQTAFAAQQLERYQTRLAAGGLPNRSAESTSLFVEAPSRSLAEADLQRRLITLVATAQARIVESGAGIVQEEDVNAIIEVRVTFDGDNTSLLKFLHLVETGIPLMIISDLSVRRIQVEESDLTANPDLRIEIVVQAPWKAEVLS